MTSTEILQNVQFVVDTKGNKKAALLELPVWEALMVYLKADEKEATEELLAIPGLVNAIEQSRQRVQAGQFARYEDIRRNV
ncbi:MAG: hypothetical protein DRQ49_11445 [Gammaproteobacteria bacterium]|nr:MAG: hypothetical protein DRQ49_11445 [Gammaproteobacteria bacterium]RKZ41191.1 MAG: hypothetical protein DRQ41_08550 [Gammaproteobacteria bacterium]RKZ73180.1 MAG: hypothetical protein DRQ57_15220 [Gammaproteobacteria bacterium]